MDFSSSSQYLADGQRDVAGNEDYYDDDTHSDQFDSYHSPPPSAAPPLLPVSAAPAALYDRSEMTVGARRIALLPTTALLPQHHSIFPSQ